MQIPVLIEPVSKNSFRARGGEPFAFTAEGTTPDEALENLRQAVTGHLAQGARVASLEIPITEHPWLPFAGMFSQDDPLVRQWLDIMAERRAAEDPD